MNYKGFIGIDISKKTLDVVVIIQGARKGEHKQFNNTLKGFKCYRHKLLQGFGCL